MTDSTETPPAPPQGQSNALTSGAPQAPQVPNALSGGAPMAAPVPGGAPNQASGPTAAQTAAALRHFDAIKKQLKLLMDDPALGKSNMKSKIIDGVTRLVASNMLKPAQSVDVLSQVPAEPLLQLRWAKNMLAQVRQAENLVLDHYGATNPNLGTVADHFASTANIGRDDHMDQMAALAANYRGGNG